MALVSSLPDVFSYAGTLLISYNVSNSPSCFCEFSHYSNGFELVSFRVSSVLSYYIQFTIPLAIHMTWIGSPLFNIFFKQMHPVLPTLVIKSWEQEKLLPHPPEQLVLQAQVTAPKKILLVVYNLIVLASFFFSFPEKNVRQW